MKKEQLKKYLNDDDPWLDWNHLFRARRYASDGSFMSAMVSAAGKVASYFKHMRVAGTEAVKVSFLALIAYWHAIFPWFGGFRLIQYSISHMESVMRFIPKHPQVVAFHLRMVEMYENLEDPDIQRLSDDQETRESE